MFGSLENQAYIYITIKRNDNMETQAQQFASIIFSYGSKRGVDFKSLTKEGMDDLVRNWYKAQVDLHNRIEAMPIEALKSAIGI